MTSNDDLIDYSPERMLEIIQQAVGRSMVAGKLSRKIFFRYVASVGHLALSLVGSMNLWLVKPETAKSRSRESLAEFTGRVTQLMGQFAECVAQQRLAVEVLRGAHYWLMSRSDQLNDEQFS